MAAPEPDPTAPTLFPDGTGLPDGGDGASGLPCAAGAGPCLRRLPGRAVWREGPALIKAYRSVGRLGRWRDRRRATAELRALRSLERAGLPVPTPRGLERREAAGGRWWCARMDWIAEAPDLAAWIARGGHPRPGLGAAALGRLVADLAAAGAALDDLHPGNLLLDSGGGAFAVDQRLARRPLDDARLERAVAGLGGRLLHATNGALRARFALALAGRRIPATEPQRRAQVRALLARLEAALLPARITQIERDLDRWLRPSSRVTELTASGQRWLVARDGAEAGLPQLERPGDEPSVWIALAGSPASVRARWLAQARAFEQGWSAIVPHALPLELARGRVVRASRHAGSAPRAWLRAPAPIRPAGSAAQQLAARATGADPYLGKRLTELLARAARIGDPPPPERLVCHVDSAGEVLLQALES